jgi:dissimilatory sulfite reductase (desulfoviridin) alpha/beta subunit
MNEKESLLPGDLEIAFSEEELLKAQEPIIPGEDDGNPESTHALTEAPLPSGAGLGQRPVLEPVLSDLDDDHFEEEKPPRVQPPNFILRLGLESGTEGKSAKEIIDENTWRLSSGQMWPVFIKRFYFSNPVLTSVLKCLAQAARRYSENRLCLGPTGYLDVFFNDRTSLEQFTQELEGKIPPHSISCPIRIEACCGLMTCPMAAVDTLIAVERLHEIFTGHQWTGKGKERPEITLTIAGCEAGQCLACGLCEYSDIILTGRRNAFPLINQTLAAISTNLSVLISGCPGKALRRSHQPGVSLELSRQKCLRCGWCVYEDHAFSWPTPQEGHLSMKLTGRHDDFPFKYVEPFTIWPELPIDLVDIGLKIIEFVEFWRGERLELESIADFAFRKQKEI